MISRLLVAILPLVILCCGIIACERKPGSTTPSTTARKSVAVSGGTVAAPKNESPDLARFHALAALVCLPLTTVAEDEDAPDESDIPAMVAANQFHVISLRLLEEPADQIGQSATFARQAFEQLIQMHRALQELNQRDESDTVAIALFGALLGEPTALLSGLSAISESASKDAATLRAWASAIDDFIAAQNLLAQQSQQYATEGLLDAPFTVDFDSGWSDDTPYDTLKLTNSMGRPLSNVLLEVRIENRAEERAKNFHFVPLWNPGEVRSAEYGIGFEIAGRPIARQTLYGVARVAIRGWCDQGSFDIDYLYLGAERDKDYQSLCDQMKWGWTFSARGSGFFDDFPCITLTLVDCEFVPEHSMTVVFRNGEQSNAYRWDFEYWREGESHKLSMQNRSFVPTIADITLSFPESRTVRTRTIELDSTSVR